jgi:hypothetical protein
MVEPTPAPKLKITNYLVLLTAGTVRMSLIAD